MFCSASAPCLQKNGGCWILFWGANLGYYNFYRILSLDHHSFLTINNKEKKFRQTKQRIRNVWHICSVPYLMGEVSCHNSSLEPSVVVPVLWHSALIVLLSFSFHLLQAKLRCLYCFPSPANFTSVHTKLDTSLYSSYSWFLTI